MAAADIEESFGNIYSPSDRKLPELPSFYVSRRVKLYSPCAFATITPDSSELNLHQQDYSGSEASSYVYPVNKYQIDLFTTTFKESGILTSPQEAPISILYARPGFGSTSLIISLIHRIKSTYNDRWVNYMDCRKAITLMGDMNSLKDENIDERKWTLAKLICDYNKIFTPSGRQQIDDFFKENDDQDRNESSIRAELFLDELDELTPKMQELLIKIVARDVRWGNNQLRVWITAGPHLRTRIQNLFPTELNIYELLPLLRKEQIKFLVNHWRLTAGPNVADSKLKKFSSDIHEQMEKLVSNFYNTIGACPSHLLQLADFLADVVAKLDTSTKEHQITRMDVTKLFEKFSKAKFEVYMDKVCEHPNNVQFVDELLLQLKMIHVWAAYTSYPKFECEVSAAFPGTIRHQEQAHKLYSVGICYENDGKLRFVHQMYAEFLLAQYYVDWALVVKNTNNMYIDFFLNTVLFDVESKAIRKFFDTYLKIQQPQTGQTIRNTSAMFWNKLHGFLIQHYRLVEETWLYHSGEEFHPAAQGRVENPRLTYDNIQENGSIAHLLIMERNFNMLQMLIDSLHGFTTEFQRFLSIKVSLRIFNENPFSTKAPTDGVEHKVDPFQMLALYGNDTEYMKHFIMLWFQDFGDAHMAQYFKNNSWTVMHYAAMNSNYHFLQALFSKELKLRKLGVNQRSPDGQLPVHMVLTKCWYYSIRIKDHPHPDWKDCVSPMLAHALSSATFAAKVSNKKHEASTSQNKKCETVDQQPQQKSPNEPESSSRSERLKTFKDIWSFEGMDKKVKAWDVYYYNGNDFDRELLASHLTCLTILIEHGGNLKAQDSTYGLTLVQQIAELDSKRLTEFIAKFEAQASRRSPIRQVSRNFLSMFRRIGNVLRSIVFCR